MSKHTFTSSLLVSNYNKDGVPRLRVSVTTKDYKFMAYSQPDGELRYLRRMILKRTSGETITMDYPRISKGTTNGKYTPHYITVSANDVKKHGFKPKEPVVVQVEW